MEQFIPATKTNEFQTYIETGKVFFGKGDYGSAVGEYQKALKICPEDKQALFELGKTYYVLKEYLDAIEILRRAIDSLADNYNASILLAKSLKSVGRYSEAIRELMKLKNLGLDYLDIDAELTSIYKDKYSGMIDLSSFDGDYEWAIKEYEERLKTNPTNEKALVQLVQCYNFIGEYEKAKRKTSETLQYISQDDKFFRNKLLNELEIAERKVVLSSKVRSLTVTLSNKCNLSCIMCITHNVPWELPRERLQEIFSLFPYLEKVMWQGGEVFVLDYFDEIISYAFQFPNLRQSIVTNGQLVTEKMAEMLVKNNVEMTFSVDGITKETYEYIRRGASFETLFRNLRLISEFKKSYNSNTILNLNVAIMKSNYHQLEGVIDFAKEYGFEFVCFMPIHIHLRTSEDIFTNRDIEALTFITQISSKIDEKAKRYGIRLENRLPRLFEEDTNRPSKKEERFPSKEGKSKKLLCHIPWQQLLIDYDGSVRPDCLCKIEKTAGSLLRSQSLEEIWNNEVMQEYRERIINHDYFGLCNPTCISGKISESHLKFP